MITKNIETKVLDMTEQEYRSLDHISYSLLSTVDRLGSGVKNDTFTGNKSTQMGNLVEDLLLGTYDKDNYYIKDISVGEKLEKATRIIAETGEFSLEEDLLKAFIFEALEKISNIDYYSSWGNEKRTEKIYTEGAEYFEYLKYSSEKMHFTTDEFNHGVHIVNTLKTHTFTKDIFNIKDNDEWTNLVQFKGRFILQLDHETTESTQTGTYVLIKFMSDLIKINHKDKYIQPYDLKTGNKKPENFLQSYLYRRYDIQDFLYTSGIIEVFKEEFPGYIVLPLKFVYVNNTGHPRPLIYYGRGKDLTIFQGYKLNGKTYRGVKDLVNDYIWYQENDFEVDFPESVYKNGGLVDLDFDDAVIIK